MEDGTNSTLLQGRSRNNVGIIFAHIHNTESLMDGRNNGHSNKQESYKHRIFSVSVEGIENLCKTAYRIRR